MDERVIWRSLPEKGVQRLHDPVDAGHALGEATRVENDEAGMCAAFAPESTIKGKEVFPIVCHDRPIGGLGLVEQLVIRNAANLGDRIHRHDVVDALAQQLSDHN